MESDFLNIIPIKELENYRISHSENMIHAYNTLIPNC